MMIKMFHISRTGYTMQLCLVTKFRSGSTSGELGKFHDFGTIAFQLPPSPSLCSDQDRIELALCATFPRDLKDNCSFSCALDTGENGLYNFYRYKASNEECESLKRRHPDGLFIWVSYIPRRWFLHQLNDESVLSATFRGRDQPANTVGHRFVYELNVEEFKQLCIDIYQLRA